MINNAHRTLFGLAIAVSILGVLFAQAPSPNHTPDLVIWLSASCLFVGALWSGVKAAKADAPAVIWPILAGGGLMLCLLVLADVLRHLHSL
jgi:hypothetical protein